MALRATSFIAVAALVASCGEGTERIDLPPMTDAGRLVRDAGPGVVPRDAGVDASIADASVADASVETRTPDASIDAGTPDAGAELPERDAGVDAGVPDAGVSFQSTPATAYTGRVVSGWVVMVADGLETSPSGTAALGLLEQKLNAVARVLPTRALSQVRQVRIWLGEGDTVCPTACYQPSSEWLADHGYEPLKGEAVEITSATRFVDWSTTQPWMMLHELAHAYHHQVLGFADSDIKASYDSVVAQQTLESVPYRSLDGPKLRHYALTNELEFFAEMSEAVFGQNDFWPFVRSELVTALPEVDALVATKWNAQ